MTARVHAGEYVIPASQTRQWFNNSRTIMPGAVVVNINGGSKLTAGEIENTVYGAMTRVFNGA